MRMSRPAATALLAVVLLGSSALLARPAGAYGDPTIGCGDRVVRESQAGPLHVYVTAPPLREFDASRSVWVYMETNGEPGLQRHDDECDRPGETHDAVVATTRILCTCDYPFGYVPESWLDPVEAWLARRLPPAP